MNSWNEHPGKAGPTGMINLDMRIACVSTKYAIRTLYFKQMKYENEDLLLTCLYLIEN
jgi:hypothetical protein